MGRFLLVVALALLWGCAETGGGGSDTDAGADGQAADATTPRPPQPCGAALCDGACLEEDGQPVCRERCDEDGQCPEGFACETVSTGEFRVDVCVPSEVPDACVPGPELCDGIDNDCDPETPDGADDRVDEACDGDDQDDCSLGVLSCEGGALLCVETEHRTETANGVDDDCDGLIDEDTLVFEGCPDVPPPGTRCDGPDADTCREGVIDDDGMCTDSTGDGCAAMTGVSLVATGWHSAHTCAFTGGTVYCWGYNNVGQSGLRGLSPREDPQEVPVANVVELTMGNNFSCARHPFGVRS